MFQGYRANPRFRSAHLAPMYPNTFHQAFGGFWMSREGTLPETNVFAPEDGWLEDYPRQQTSAIDCCFKHFRIFFIKLLLRPIFLGIRVETTTTHFLKLLLGFPPGGLFSSMFLAPLSGNNSFKARWQMLLRSSCKWSGSAVDYPWICFFADLFTSYHGKSPFYTTIWESIFWTSKS